MVISITTDMGVWFGAWHHGLVSLGALQLLCITVRVLSTVISSMLTLRRLSSSSTIHRLQAGTETFRATVVDLGGVERICLGSMVTHEDLGCHHCSFFIFAVL